jgi:hypothetical protein
LSPWEHVRERGQGNDGSFCLNLGLTVQEETLLLKDGVLILVEVSSELIYGLNERAQAWVQRMVDSLA